MTKSHAQRPHQLNSMRGRKAWCSCNKEISISPAEAALLSKEQIQDHLIDLHRMHRTKEEENENNHQPAA